MAKVAARLSAHVQRELALPLKYSLVRHTEFPPLKIGPQVPKCKMADRPVADGAHVQLGWLQLSLPIRSHLPLEKR